MIDYVRVHADRFGVEPILAVLNEHGIGVAPSTFYSYAARGFGPTVAELADAYAANELHRLWVRNRRLYGGGSCGRPRAVPGSTSAATRWNA